MKRVRASAGRPGSWIVLVLLAVAALTLVPIAATAATSTVPDASVSSSAVSDARTTAWADGGTGPDRAVTGQEQADRPTEGGELASETADDGYGLTPGDAMQDAGTVPSGSESDTDRRQEVLEVSFGMSPTTTSSNSHGLTDGAESIDFSTHTIVFGPDSTGLTEGVAPTDGVMTPPREASPLAPEVNSDFPGQRVERPWAIDPSSPLSPAMIGGVAFGFVLGTGAYAAVLARREQMGGISSVDDDLERTDPVPAGPAVDEDELMPDEEVVEGLLMSQEGRMKQSAIVSMTDWSKAKVSRLLSRMAEEGRVVKIRLGRENLICLDGWEPEALGRPHSM